MTSHRKIGSLLLAAALALATPVAASANPLLSGYGGPGQGSQAILGSAIVGGGSGGGGGGSTGGGSTGGGGSAEGGTSTGASSPNAFHYGEPYARTGSSSRGGGGGGSAAAGSRGSTAAGGAHITQAHGAQNGAYPAASAERAYLASSASQTAGLSSDDLALVLFALVVLALVAALTRALVRTGVPAAHRPLKQRVAGPE